MPQSNEKYFLIYNSDGDTYVKEIHIAEFLKEIEDGGYGDHPKFLGGLPKESDTNYWEDSYLIIKGKVVSPKPVEIATKYEIE